MLVLIWLARSLQRRVTVIRYRDDTFSLDAMRVRVMQRLKISRAVL